VSLADVAQAQLDAYNAQDLDRYCAYFDEDCVIADLNGAMSSSGRAAIRERYAKTFASFPQNRAKLLNRIALGNVVIDHEDVERSPGGERFQVAAIYTFRGDRIARVDFVK
jgi:uncharacterized protein (TIGR02246 family)